MLESTCNTPRNPLHTTKEFFLKPIYQRILRICTMALLYFTFHVFFFNLVIPARSNALICTRKPNPEDSGRSSNMASVEGLNVINGPKCNNILS